jgi:hypothetical protein
LDLRAGRARWPTWNWTLANAPPAVWGTSRLPVQTVHDFFFFLQRFLLGLRLDVIQIPSFFTLSVTSIFSRLHGVLNVGKK